MSALREARIRTKSLELACLESGPQGGALTTRAIDGPRHLPRLERREAVEAAILELLGRPPG